MEDIQMTTRNLSRRALIAGAAVLSTTAIPAVAIADGNPDAEILSRGVELEGIIGEWHAKCERDAAFIATRKAAIEAAGLRYNLAPVDFSPDFSSFAEYHAYIAKCRVATASILDSDEDEAGEDVVWSDIHDRLHPLCEDILEYRPRTVAGLGVQARAMSIFVEDLCPDEDGVRAFVEAVCAFSGVVPVTSDHVGQPGEKAVAS
jgi:hypothetical protein